MLILCCFSESLFLEVIICVIFHSYFSCYSKILLYYKNVTPSILLPQFHLAPLCAVLKISHLWNGKHACVFGNKTLTTVSNPKLLVSVI